MPITIDERYNSRESTESEDDPTVELLFVVQGTDNDILVKALVEATAPTFYDGLKRDSFTVSTLGGGVWECRVRYVKIESESEYTFDTGGGTQHITESIQTVGTYPAPDEIAPDFDGAIGVNQDQIEGTDITVPVFNFTETHFFPDSFVTTAYKGTVFQLTGKVNQTPFKGFAPGEVLFMGASGSKHGFEDWEMTFRFAAFPNISDLTLGPITGIAKKGWEYLWVRFADDEDDDAKTLVKKPIAAYVEQVYHYGDFASLGIGV